MVLSEVSLWSFNVWVVRQSFHDLITVTSGGVFHHLDRRLTYLGPSTHSSLLAPTTL